MNVDAYNRAVSDAHSAATDDDAIRRAELSALIQTYHGHSLDRHTFDKFADVQAQLHTEQAELAERLDAGALAPEFYLKQLNASLAVGRPVAATY